MGIYEEEAPINEVIPDIVRSYFRTEVAQNNILLATTSGSYTEELAVAGDTVQSNKLSHPTSQVYLADGTDSLEYAEAEPTASTFTLDKSYMWTQSIETTKMRLSNMRNWNSAIASGFAFEVNKDVNKSGLEVIANTAGITTDLGSKTTPIDLADADDALEVLYTINTKIRKADTRGNRVVVLPVELYAKIARHTDFISNQLLGYDVLTKGTIQGGQLFGMTVFEAPDGYLPETATYQSLVAYSTNAVEFAMAIYDYEVIKAKYVAERKADLHRLQGVWGTKVETTAAAARVYFTL